MFHFSILCTSSYIFIIKKFMFQGFTIWYTPGVIVFSMMDFVLWGYKKIIKKIWGLL